MIKTRKPLSMAESSEYLQENKEEIKGFFKKFLKIKPEKAKELREKIKKLDLMKIKEEHISKIIDFLPEDTENLNKIFRDVNLEEDEQKKLLDTIKEYR